jgi:hypothetical protein
MHCPAIPDLECRMVGGSGVICVISMSSSRSVRSKVLLCEMGGCASLLIDVCILSDLLSWNSDTFRVDLKTRDVGGDK